MLRRQAGLTCSLSRVFRQVRQSVSQHRQRCLSMELRCTTVYRLSGLVWAATHLLSSRQTIGEINPYPAAGLRSTSPTPLREAVTRYALLAPCRPHLEETTVYLPLSNMLKCTTESFSGMVPGSGRQRRFRSGISERGEANVSLQKCDRQARHAGFPRGRHQRTQRRAIGMHGMQHSTHGVLRYVHGGHRARHNLQRRMPADMGRVRKALHGAVTVISGASQASCVAVCKSQYSAFICVANGAFTFFC
jgi:hypothetical protein